MRMIKTTFAAALALCVAATPALAAAPAAKAKPKAAPTAAVEPPASEDKVKNAMLYLKVLISGLESKNVDQPAKGALVGCLYKNSLGTITDSMDKAIAANSGKIHRDNMNELLSAMVMICGYNPSEAAAVKAAPAPSNDGAASAQSGR